MRFRELKLRKDPDARSADAPDHPGAHRLRPVLRHRARDRQPPGPPLPRPRPQPTPAGAEITPVELKARLDRGDHLVLLDVREPHETQICNLDGSTLMPLGDLPRRFSEIDRGRDLVVDRRAGVRSARAVQFLARQGLDRAVNLDGGILRWIDEVDPTQPKYERAMLRLSKKADYALIAMKHLALRADSGSSSGARARSRRATTSPSS